MNCMTIRHESLKFADLPCFTSTIQVMDQLKNVVDIKLTRRNKCTKIKRIDTNDSTSYNLRKSLPIFHHRKSTEFFCRHQSLRSILRSILCGLWYIKRVENVLYEKKNQYICDKQHDVHIGDWKKNHIWKAYFTNELESLSRKEKNNHHIIRRKWFAGCAQLCPFYRSHKNKWNNNKMTQNATSTLVVLPSAPDFRCFY